MHYLHYTEELTGLKDIIITFMERKQILYKILSN